MTIENTTANQSYPLPNASNILSEDVLRLIAAIQAIDADLAQVVAQLAGLPTSGHTHSLSDVIGLVEALSAKAASDHEHSLNALTDVDTSSSTTNQFLMKSSTDWIPAALAASHITSGTFHADRIPAITESKLPSYLAASVIAANTEKISYTDAATVAANALNITALQEDAYQQGTAIPANADLNDYVTTGWHHQNSNSNAASGSNYPNGVAGLLEVYNIVNMTYQRYTEYSGAGGDHVWIRGRYNTNWSTWVDISPDLVSQTDAENGTGTAVKKWTPLRVKQAIEALGGGITPTEFNFTSLANSSLFTLPHLAGAVPTKWQAFLVCTSTDRSYAVDDIMPAAFNGVNSTHYLSVSANATHFKVATGANPPFLVSATGGASSRIVWASWKVLVIAEI